MSNKSGFHHKKNGFFVKISNSSVGFFLTNHMIFSRYRLQTKQSICNSFLTKKPMKPLSPLRKNSHIDLFYVCCSVTVSSEFKSSVSSDDVVSISADSDEEAYGSSCLGSEGSTVSSVDSVE